MSLDERMKRIQADADAEAKRKGNEEVARAQAALEQAINSTEWRRVKEASQDRELREGIAEYFNTVKGPGPSRVVETAATAPIQQERRERRPFWQKSSTPKKDAAPQKPQTVYLSFTEALEIVEEPLQKKIILRLTLSNYNGDSEYGSGYDGEVPLEISVFYLNEKKFVDAERGTETIQTGSGKNFSQRRGTTMEAGICFGVGEGRFSFQTVHKTIDETLDALAKRIIAISEYKKKYGIT